MRICLIHWNEKERQERVSWFAFEGIEVLEGIAAGPQFAKALEAAKPDVVVIDLSRLPSQGRDLGVLIRARAGTRQIPIVFVEGVEDKLAAIRGLLPDAEFTTWVELLPVLKRAVKSKEKFFMPQPSVFAAYSQKPLSTKLGIKPGYLVCLIGETEDLLGGSEALPERVNVTTEVDSNADLYLWCLQSQAELSSKLAMIKSMVKHAPSWVGWPKKTAEIKSDLNQAIVREQCMAVGMVDYKICSINERWSALLFAWRG
jgi:CheY-like chemotaxis protein